MKKALWIPLLFFLLLSLLFLWGVTLYPWDATLPSGPSLHSPSTTHWLGTDNLGVDVFAQISAGYFRSMAIGVLTALCTFLVGGILGICAGLAGGWIDEAIGLLIQVFLSIPQLPAMIVLGAFLGQNTWNIIWILALFSWAPVAKILRAKTRSVCDRDYIHMARLYGGGTLYLIRTHLAQDLLPLLSVNALSVVGKSILQESSLAFLGLSDPLARSWGLMIARATQFPGIYRTHFWLWWLLAPVLAMVLSTLLLRLMVQAIQLSKS